MTAVCAILHGHEGPGPVDTHGCVLPEGHDGPHEFVAEDGRRWLWETDLTCNCEHCARCQGDYCTVYWLKPDTSLAPTVEEYEQALALLAGLHPGLTIDGPPLEVAARIFDAVMAERAHHEQEIRRQERALESMRAHAWSRP